MLNINVLDTFSLDYERNLKISMKKIENFDNSTFFVAAILSQIVGKYEFENEKEE